MNLEVIPIIIGLVISPTLISTTQIYIQEPLPIVESYPEVLEKIAFCESGQKQFNDDGSVLISPTSDVGYFQINQVHWDRAKELGIDLWTLEGNREFAELLYDERGVQPWYMSEHCWG